MAVKYAVVQLRPHGMFSNVNQVIDALYLAEQGGYGVLVRWGRDSCYYDPATGSKDVWGYYFEPVCQHGPDRPGRGDFVLENTAYRKENVITPRCRDSNTLRPPRDRFLVRDIIERHIRLKPHIVRIVEQFASTHLQKRRGPLVGLHVRGAGKQDGGAEIYKPRLELARGVPFAAYREKLDAYLAEHPESTIFLASDSQMVVDSFSDWYGERVKTYPSIRDHYGEMHARNPRGWLRRKPRFSPYRLGEDVVVEAYLLSSADHFIHGISNVSAFVACNNPQLTCEDVYARFRS